MSSRFTENQRLFYLQNLLINEYLFMYMMQTLQTDYDKLEAAHDMLKSEKSSLDAIFNQTAEEVVKVKSSLAETLILQSKLEAAVARMEHEKKVKQLFHMFT